MQSEFRAADSAMQTHGMGLINEIDLVHAWQDRRIVDIAGGSNEIPARMIAQRPKAGRSGFVTPGICR